MDLIRFIFSNMLSNKLRYIIIIISVSISIGSITLIITVSDIGQTMIEQKINKSGVNNLLLNLENNKFSHQEDLDNLKNKVNNIKYISPVYMKESVVSIREKTDDISIWGVNQDTENVVGTKTIYGRSISESDVLENKKVCIIDRKIAQKFYNRENIVGKNINIKINNKYNDFLVIGVMDASENIINMTLGDYLKTFVYIPFSTMEDILNDKGFKGISISLKNNDERDLTERQLNNIIYSSFNEYPKIETFVKGYEIIYSIIGITKFVLTLIASISMLISGFMIMLVMINNVSEKINEISLKKAIGATNMDILKEFILQSIIICVVSFLISVTFIYLFLFLVLSYFKINFYIDFKLLFYIFFASVFIGIVFGAYPSYKASKLNPCDGLRQ